MARDNLSCWVLTEGLAGTENQCIGLAEALGVQPVVKRAAPRSTWRSILRLPVSLERLAPRSDALAPPWPDLLIASGRKCVGLAQSIRRASRGRTYAVFVQNPRVPEDRFDLVFAPRHDSVKGNNVFTTRGALNRVTPERLEDAAQQFADLLGGLPRPLIAVLIGGTTLRHQLDAEAARIIGERLAASAKSKGAGLAITASRRTGTAAVSALRAALGSTPAVIWTGEGENPYFGFLALADAIVVTGDSISMTSEACTTGKPVYVVPLAGRGSKRFRRFFSELEAEGVIRPFSGTFETWRYAPLRDTAEAAGELRRRFDLWRDLKRGGAAP